MNLKIRPVTKEEEKFLYSINAHDINMRSGCIGYLRGDFGTDGKDFWTNWFDVGTNWKSDAFKEILDNLVNALRRDGMLKSRDAMRRFVKTMPDSVIHSAYCEQYAFNIDCCENFTFLIRCNPVKGDYNFYLYCYVNPWFKQHIERSKAGIRFIDPDYKELFRLEDGGRIIIKYPNAVDAERTCYYIDEYHMAVCDHSPSAIANVFHICQFAEFIRDAHATVRPKT